MILIYFIKEKQAIDVASLNNDFVKFKNDKTDISGIEKIFVYR